MQCPLVVICPENGNVLIITLQLLQAILNDLFRGKKTIVDDSQCSKRFLALENYFKILLEKKGVKEKMMINIHRNPLFQQFLLQSTIFVDPKIYGRVAL